MKRFLLIGMCLFLYSISINAATLTVTKTADTNDGICNADCSLREAISLAVGGDVIEFSTLFNTTQFIALNGTELVIDKSLTINGTGAEKLTVDGGFASRVFNISGMGNTINLNGIKISSGFVSSATICRGGGINITDAVVNLDSVIVDLNFVASNIGTDCFGGGIYNQGTLNITKSTVSNNSANSNTNGIGGGIANGRIVIDFANGKSKKQQPLIGGVISATITDSTISGNFSNSCGGGIDNQRNLTLRGVTITNNTCNSTNRASGVHNGFFSSTNISNTLIAGNQNDRDVFGNFTSQGFNLVGSPMNGTTGFIQPADQVGTTASPINPLLGILSNNGGPTPTHALLPQSPAIDKGNNFGSTNDQRGTSRTIDLVQVSNASGGDGTDIGAFEALGPTSSAILIGGKILSSKRAGLKGAIVELTDLNGNRLVQRTNQFGYFQFRRITAGETYILTVYSKQHQFSPQVINATESIVDLTVTPNKIQ